METYKFTLSSLEDLKQHQFEVYLIGTAFNNVGGVYVSLRCDSERNHTLLYIDQTHSLKERRLEYQEKWECAAPIGGNVICIRREDKGTQGKAKENYLIDKYQSPCNKQ